MSAATMDSVSAAAASLGLTMQWLEDGVGGVRVVVSREAEDWSVEPQAIAIGRDVSIVAANAMRALQQLAPRLQKKLSALSVEIEEPERLGLAAGAGMDGVVTTLRVERDGSVRLHPDDIEAIAKRTADLIEDRRLYARTGLRVGDE